MIVVRRSPPGCDSSAARAAPITIPIAASPLACASTCQPFSYPSATAAFSFSCDSNVGNPAYEGSRPAAAAWYGRLRYAVYPCRSEEHTSELQSLTNLVCRLLLEKKKNFHGPERAVGVVLLSVYVHG